MPQPPAEPAPEPLPATATVARFGSVAAALAFAAATPGRVVPRCLRYPADGSVWVTTSLSAGAAAALAASLSGTCCTLVDGRLQAAGSQPVPPLDALAPIRLPLLAAMILPARQPAGPLTEMTVVTTGPLAGPIIRRCSRLAADLAIVPVQREPLPRLGGTPPPGAQGAVLIRIRCRAGGVLPPAAIMALTDTPRTIVCRDAGNILVDVRLALPLDDRRLSAEVPGDESWILGGADTGAWRIIERGEQVSLDFEPAIEIPPAPAPPPAPLPASYRSTVRVVPAPDPDGRADAMLLEDADLARLRRLITGRPLGETAFIVLGPGHHLLTEPAGLMAIVPFGIPVRRIGPAGLYLQAGHIFDPPMPEAARGARFGLDGESIVVVCAHRAFRLRLADTIPAWTLWLGPVPEPTGGISERGRRLLEGLTAAGAEAGPVPDPTGPPDRAQLLDRALRLEHSGQLAEAARCLEEGGELYRAALLWERAAREAAP